MRRSTKFAFCGLLLAALAACGSPAPPQDEAEAREKGRDTDQTVFDDMLETQDEARAVEEVTLGHKADLDAALEQAEGNAQDEAE
jgi:hypothetical protein